ncbi:MAG: hypothetical protein IJ008_01660 [Clostridia bacterium]|nr:hypothetical protein [Clostridia bacterium]
MKEKNVPSSLMFVCLDEVYRGICSKNVADELGLYYANCRDLIAYDLVERDKVRELCGVEYLQKREQKVIKDISKYENVLVDIDFDTLFNNVELFKKNCLIVYLYLEKEKIDKDKNPIDFISFEDRDNYLTQNSDFKIKITKNFEKDLEEIFANLGGNL